MALSGGKRPSVRKKGEHYRSLFGIGKSGGYRTAWIEKSEIPAYGFDFRLTVCNHCHNVVAVPVLVTGEDETYEGHCPLCGKKTASPPEDLEKEPCPVCKIKALKTEIEGHWD